MNKIKLGISSCLLGENVRYDGGNKLDRYLMDAFGHIVEWVPFCPEVEAGLTVPREPMQLVDEARGMRLITIETKRDRTNGLIRWAEKKLRQLEQGDIRGFVLKARSPSCGVHNAPHYSAAGHIIGVGAGLFAQAVGKRFSSLPVEDEERLRDAAIREKFLARIFEK
jgi:uncharacterized protein YbbK (DUF523 family)